MRMQLLFFKSKGGIKEICAVKEKNVLQNKVQLFQDKQIFLFFSWGQANFYVLGNLMLQKLIFSPFFLQYNFLFLCRNMYYLINLYFA